MFGYLPRLPFSLREKVSLDFYPLAPFLATLVKSLGR